MKYYLSYSLLQQCNFHLLKKILLFLLVLVKGGSKYLCNYAGLNSSSINLIVTFHFLYLHDFCLITSFHIGLKDTVSSFFFRIGCQRYIIMDIS